MPGDTALAAAAIAADDEIDAMNVSLTERCYDLLVRESPVASDLRLVVSVAAGAGELERIGDLALRVVKLAPDHGRSSRAASAATTSCSSMADEAVERSARRCGPGRPRTSASPPSWPRRAGAMDLCNEQLIGELLRLDGPDAVADRAADDDWWAGPSTASPTTPPSSAAASAT